MINPRSRRAAIAHGWLAPSTKLYFEAHITIDPASVYNPRRLDLLKALAHDADFRVADFMMVHADAPQPKPFLSCRNSDYRTIVQRMEHMCTNILVHNAFKVLRYKIENTLVDSNHQEDPLGILKNQEKWLPVAQRRK